MNYIEIYPQFRSISLSTDYYIEAFINRKIGLGLLGSWNMTYRFNPLKWVSNSRYGDSIARSSIIK